MLMDVLRSPEGRQFNNSFTKLAVHYSADSFVVNQILVFRTNICAKIFALRQAAKR